ncbi:hypothetical protein diail_11197 [Diaporthe ilicicola]|nr:hypothetical protein diail_11197 [Diaporthe ilicicola]
MATYYDEYGFNPDKIVSSSNSAKHLPTLHPFPEMTAAYHNEHGNAADHFSCDKQIAAIFVFTSPRDWNYDNKIRPGEEPPAIKTVYMIVDNMFGDGDLSPGAVPQRFSENQTFEPNIFLARAWLCCKTFNLRGKRQGGLARMAEADREALFAQTRERIFDYHH